MGEGDGRAIPCAPFIEEEVDVQSPGSVAVSGPFSAELTLDLAKSSFRIPVVGGVNALQKAGMR